ncbi:hypothetical protein ASE35_07680 [Lysobacter sp. Root916]|uniref:hypothetical protein n=1 Tax=Lysobacter sp. Root916 TaxID=1736606 RepID=UPI000708EA0B|nr:hypothetical protein [Lysobacter sp. Root916]KRD34621.1 hypothetical protein ASE35_07680 [Lysobacter sp. Root916]
MSDAPHPNAIADRPRGSALAPLLLALAACSCGDAPSAPAAAARAQFADTAKAQAAPASADAVEEFLQQVRVESDAADARDKQQGNMGYTGRLAEAIASEVAYAEKGGAARRFVVANRLWALAPATSERLHRSADELLPDQPLIVYELALHYTRNDDCPRALPLWKRLKTVGALPPQATFLYAYCQLATGDERGAYDLVQTSKVRETHVGAEKMSYAVFGGTDYLTLHDEDYRKAEAGDRVALDRALARAFDWRSDWWNYGQNAAARDALHDLMARLWSAQKRERAEWDCLWPLLIDSERKLGVADLDRCQLLVGAHSYPASSALGRIVLGRLAADAEDELDFSAFHARHAATLRERAYSSTGDFEALRVLAFLQQSVGDEAGLAQTDELGWKRYRDETFARSRIEHAHPAPGQTPDAAFRAMLQQAMRDFPQVPRFILIDAVYRHPDGELPVADLSRLLQAETRDLNLSQGQAGVRSSTQLLSMYRRLGQALNATP